MNRTIQLGICCIFACCLVPLRLLHAEPSRETRIITAAVFYVGRFTRWENPAPGNSFRVCVLGDQEELEDLKLHFRGKSFEGAAASILQLDTVAAAAKSECRILYIGLTGQATDETLKALPDLQQAGVLTIGRSSSFIQHGGMLEISERDNRLRILVNRAALTVAPFRFSSELLSLATFE